MKIYLLLLSILVFSACDEPNKLVQNTVDGRFSITLSMERNWIRPDESIPVLMEIKNLNGTLEEGWTEPVELIVNNGSINQSTVFVTFPDPGDSSHTEPDRFYTWLTLTGPDYRYVYSPQEGEIQAVFLDKLTRLHFRVLPAEDSLDATSQE